jgi:hypothetical protein
MRSFMQAISSDLFVNDRHDHANVGDMLQLRTEILERLCLYARRALSGSAQLPGAKSPGTAKVRCAVPAVVLATTALASTTCWRPEQPVRLPAFACSR